MDIAPNTIMSISEIEGLQQQLESIDSISSLQQILAANGIDKSQKDITKSLLSSGAFGRFRSAPEEVHNELANLIVLSEQEPQLLALLSSGGDINEITDALTSFGLTPSNDLIQALQAPAELSDDQLEQIVGGSLTLSILGLVLPPMIGLVSYWIQEHYSTQRYIANTQQVKA